jgi:hypothetical protein
MPLADLLGYRYEAAANAQLRTPSRKQSHSNRLNTLTHRPGLR